MLTIGLTILGLFILPLAVPVNPVENTLPVSKLADSDSHFTNINGVNFHYKIMGKGEPVFFLLHGFGASLYSWRKVMPELAKYGTVIAFDRLGFGLTERLVPGQWSNQNPYGMAAQVKNAVGLLKTLGHNQAVWIGHSAGGTVSVTAAAFFQSNITALILVDPAILNPGMSPFVQALFAIPSVDHLAPLLIRDIRNWGMKILDSAWFDTNKITQDDLMFYNKPLSMSNWDIGLWEFTKAAGENEAGKLFGKLKMPVLLISGDHDLIVPLSDTVSLTNLVPHAELVIISNCGHIPQEEQPEAFLKEVIGFIKALK